MNTIISLFASRFYFDPHLRKPKMWNIYIKFTGANFGTFATNVLDNDVWCQISWMSKCE